MSEKLTDPNKAAHEIVNDPKGDDDAVRNDGVVLQAANKNPWYVLATIYGEQEEGADLLHHNKSLAERNRRAWNLWFGWELDDDDLEKRAKKIGIKLKDLLPCADGKVANPEQDKLNDYDRSVLIDIILHIEDELNEIHRLYISHMQQAGVEAPVLPPRTAEVDFSRRIFTKFVSFKGYHFFDCNFNFASFCGAVSFADSQFNGPAKFAGAKFVDCATFVRATFKDYAVFKTAEFCDQAYFMLGTFNGDLDISYVAFGNTSNLQSAKFLGRTNFRSSKFNGATDFSSVQFASEACFEAVYFDREIKFNSAHFKAAAIFTDARFSTFVPEFHAAEIYDDTLFPTKAGDVGNWPPLRGVVKLEGRDEPVAVMDAEAQKRAYNRLRLFMNRSLQIDEEQFFHRMEMRCKWRLAGWGHKPIFAMFALLSDFGNSVMRPIVGIVSVILFGALFMLWMQGGFTFTAQTSTGFDWSFGMLGAEDVWAAPRQAVGWSASNSLPFLGFGTLYYGGEFAKDLAWPLRVVGGVQTLLGYSLLFLLGLGLRNRFRLR